MVPVKGRKFNPELSASGSGRDSSQLVCQVLNSPVGTGKLKPVRGCAVLPHCKPNGSERILLQSRLTQQAGHVAAQQVAGTPLCQMRVARGIHK
jgi:hypothetical protein